MCNYPKSQEGNIEIRNFASEALSVIASIYKGEKRLENRSSELLISFAQTSVTHLGPKWQRFIPESKATSG